MAKMIGCITAIWLVAASSVFAAGETDKVAEKINLQGQIAEQGQEISTLALYAARLKKLLGNAPANAGGAAKLPDEKLQEVLLELDFDKVGLSDALNTVKDAAKINLTVDWKALHDAAIEKNTPVTRHLRNITVQRALTNILSPDDGNPSPVWFGVENGAVSITTLAELARHPVNKTYDVKFLLGHINPGNPKDAQVQLTKAILQAVSPDSWKDTGAKAGPITFAGTTMTVTQSRAVQVEVEKFLRTVEDVDLDMGNQHARATAAEQARQITALRAEIAAVATRMRAAGKKVPPEPLPLDKALAKMLPEVKFDGVGLSDCIDFVRDVTGQQIFVNWKALEDAGIDRNTPVTLHLVNRPLRDAVTQLLSIAAAGKAKTGFDVDGDELELSTQAELDTYALTLNYEVRDLLPAGVNQEQAAQQLAQSIQRAIEPATWHDAGGTLGSIHLSGGELAITQSNRVHRLIREYIDGLRHPGGKAK